MSDEQKYTIHGLNEYIRQGEPQQRERSEAWRVAIVPKCKSGLPKCKSGRRIASKVQNLHFGRGGAAAHRANESVCHSKRYCQEIGKSERTVKSITIALQEKDLLQRMNGKRNGYWKIVEE